MKFNDLLKKAKLRLLKLHYDCNVGHLGGNLSALDAILLLHAKILKSDDAFVLSKGHSAGALYVTLWALGDLSEEELSTFHQDDSLLAGHPVAGWHPRIPFSTGSLGHGLSLAIGLALAKKIKNREGKVYCLLSDGEWEEGTTWEALIFLIHHKLDNIVLLVDVNGLQGFGSTTEVASLEPLGEKIRSFGIDVLEIDGHDPFLIESVLAQGSNGPRAILLRTVKGNGISFMQDRMEWHYLPLNQSQYELAIEEVRKV